MHRQLVLLRGEQTKVNEQERKVVTRERNKRHQTVTPEARRQQDVLDNVLSGDLSGDRSADPRGVGGGIGPCVGGVIRERDLIIRKDGVEGLLLARQQLCLLDEYHVISQSKFGQCFVDVVLIVSVV